MFFRDEEIRKEFGALPESIKKAVVGSGRQIKSVDELRELVRRIQNVQTGRIN